MSSKIYPIGVQSFGSLIAVRKQQMIIFIFESTKI